MTGTPSYEGGRHVPNILTVLRLLLAAAFFIVLIPWQYENSPAPRGLGIDWWVLFSAFLFVVAALTDALDGFLARRWGVVSVFGRVMDPFADKLLIIGAFILLAGRGFMMSVEDKTPYPMSAVTPWMVIVILGRELLVTSIRAVAESDGASFAASASGKLKMILQSVVVPVILVLLAFPQTAPRTGPHGIDPIVSHRVIQFLVWLTVAVTIWSGIPYIQRAMVIMRKSRPERAA
jgi:CDP-diacylglycerol--glycerol-3-phosphate 3-phosphatidyltransferase